MSRLARFGRRQFARLHSLTSRQAIVLLGVGALCAGVAVASAADRRAVATTLLAVLLGAVLVGVLHLSRRIGGLHRIHQASMRDLRVVVDQLQRRVVATVEKERVAAAARHRDLTDVLARGERGGERITGALLREQIRETEAALQLFRDVAPRAPMPPSAGDGPGSADLLGLLHLVRNRRPGLTVTLGAGPAAVWLAYALEPTGGRVVAVEHERERAERTRALLAAHGLAALAEVVHAPLAEPRTGGDPGRWYDRTALAGLQDVDLLVVDGPAGLSTRDRVSVALRLLGPKLAGGAAVVVDDGPGARAGSAALEGSLPESPVVGRYTALAYVPPSEATTMTAVPS
jgi:predicted O-methyltransferase YrrM